MKKLLTICLLVFVLQACEDQVSIDLKDAPPVLVVDAWVDNTDQVQTIRLTKTQPYFDASQINTVSDASVFITDSLGNTFDFIETTPGNYIWNPADHNFSFNVGYQYELSITAEGNAYLALSKMNRVPPLDSIVYTYYEERNAFQPEGYYAEFVAKDPVGVGDSYWIKSYKNGQYLSRPFDLNIAYDAGFSSAGGIDGLVFIQPIQNAVTPLNEDMDAFDPYIIGDSLFVEIHSVSNEAFTFLEELGIQTQRDGGFDEIFAEPLENIPTNIHAVEDRPNDKVVGFFNIAAVSAKGKKLED